MVQREDLYRWWVQHIPIERDSCEDKSGPSCPRSGNIQTEVSEDNEEEKVEEIEVTAD